MPSVLPSEGYIPHSRRDLIHINDSVKIFHQPVIVGHGDQGLSFRHLRKLANHRLTDGKV